MAPFLTMMPMIQRFSRHLFPALFCAAILVPTGSAMAQELGVPPADIGEPAPDPVRRGIVQRPAPPPAPERTFEAMPVVVLQGLDKVTARTSTFEVKVGETGQFGPLAILVKSCRKAAPIDTPESAAFLEVTDNGADSGGTPVPVFTGWMFASSPALSAMEHPVYDVWVKDCRKSVTSARSSTPTP